MRRWWLLLLIPLFLALAFVLWALSGPAAMPEAEAALSSNSQVDVEKDSWIVFRPAEREPAAGLILYPGGRVDPAAYAPLAQAVAADGYLVAIVPMPLNLAFLGSDRALGLIDAFPEISTWALAGHSLGGAKAASFVDSHPGLVDGLALWAAYPSQADDLSAQKLVATSIYGTDDGIASLDEIRGAEELLPSDTQWEAIEGGNHSQFGWYGLQSGDNPAAFSREDQQDQIVKATLDLLKTLSERR